MDTLDGRFGRRMGVRSDWHADGRRRSRSVRVRRPWLLTARRSGRGRGRDRPRTARRPRASPWVSGPGRSRQQGRLRRFRALLARSPSRTGGRANRRRGRRPSLRGERLPGGRGCLRGHRCRQSILRRPNGRGRRRSRRRRCRIAALRQQRERIEVPLRIVGQPDAEVDVRRTVLRVPGRPDRPDPLAFGDAVVGADQDRAQMEQRDGVAVGCPDRHRLAMRGQPPRERDSSAGRREDGGSSGAVDVDPRMAVLPVLGTAEVETAEHAPVGRPGPRAGRCRCEYHCACEQDDARCHLRQHRPATVAGGSAVVKNGYSERR